MGLSNSPICPFESPSEPEVKYKTNPKCFFFRINQFINRLKAKVSRVQSIMTRSTRATSHSNLANSHIGNRSPRRSPRKIGSANRKRQLDGKKSQEFLSEAVFEEMKNKEARLAAVNKDLRASIREKNKLLLSSKLELEDSQRSFRLVTKGLRQQLKSTKLAMGTLQEYSRQTIDDLNQQLVSSQLALENLEQHFRPDIQNKNL